MYHAMTELPADTSTFKGPIKLSAPPSGASVAGAGRGHRRHVAAMELRDAGYKVQVLNITAVQRTELEPVWRRHLYRTGRLHPEGAIRSRPVHQSRPVAPPYHHQGICIM